jgi:plasmid stabilization system protein ParE
MKIRRSVLQKAFAPVPGPICPEQPDRTRRSDTGSIPDGKTVLAEEDPAGLDSVHLRFGPEYSGSNGLPNPKATRHPAQSPNTGALRSKLFPPVAAHPSTNARTAKRALQTNPTPETTTAMPRRDKTRYTDKQKRQAGHIEESYEERGLSPDEAESRAWATVNKLSGGGKKSGSGRRNHPTPARTKRARRDSSRRKNAS